MSAARGGTPDGVRLERLRDGSRSARSAEEARDVLRAAGVIGRSLTNESLGLTVVISNRDVAKMTSEKAVKKSVSPRLHTLAVANADKVFEAAFVDGTHADTHGRKEVRRTHRLGSAVYDPASGRFEPVLVTVLEYVKDGTKMYTVKAIDVAKYENSAGQLAAVTVGERQAPIAEFVKSIANRVAEVNGDTAKFSAGRREYDDVVARYTNADGSRKPGWMKAPNGKPTSLSERQWVQARTPSFKKWFGDWENDPANASKVVDANGEPLVVYHGTNATEDAETWNARTRTYDTEHRKFTVFRRDAAGGRNAGHFFSDSADVAGSMGSEVYAVHLAMRNPLVVDAQGRAWGAIPFGGGLRDANEVAAYAEAHGHDGLILRNVRDGAGVGDMERPATDYVVFDSRQIKSATENTGAFDAGNPDIKFSVARGEDALKEMRPVETRRVASSYAEARTALAPQVGKTFRNKETGVEATLSNNSVNKLLSGKAVAKSVGVKEHLAAVANVTDLFENGRLLATDEGSRKGVLSAKRFFSRFRYNGEDLIAKTTVLEYERGDHRIYSVEAMEVEKAGSILAPKGSTNQAENPALPSTPHIVPQSGPSAQEGAKLAAGGGSGRGRLADAFALDPRAEVLPGGVRVAADAGRGEGEGAAEGARVLPGRGRGLVRVADAGGRPRGATASWASSCGSWASGAYAARRRAARRPRAACSRTSSRRSSWRCRARARASSAACRGSATPSAARSPRPRGRTARTRRARCAARRGRSSTGRTAGRSRTRRRAHEAVAAEIRRSMSRATAARLAELERAANEPISAGSALDDAKETVLVALHDRMAPVVVRIDAKAKVLLKAKREALKARQ